VIGARRDMFAEYLPVDRAVADGDVLRAGVQASISGVLYDAWTRDGAGIKAGSGLYGSGFDSEIIGMAAGDEKAFSVELPADFSNSDVANKTVDFSVKVHEVLERKIPELTDELAKKASRYETVESWKAHVREDLEHQSKHESEDKLRADLVDLILNDVKIAVQSVLVDRETHNMLHQFERQIRQSGMNLEQYMKMSGKSMDDMKADLKENAEKRVKTQLVLDTIAEIEKIEATDADCEAEILKWNMPNVLTVADLKKVNVQLDDIKDSIRMRKTYDFIIANAKIG
jgi:trigger factor